MTCKSMLHPTTGKPTSKQLIISARFYEHEAQILVSYGKNVAMTYRGRIILDTYYWDYSRTTAKYRNLFLNTSIEGLAALISDGTATFADLQGIEPEWHIELIHEVEKE